MTLVVKYMGELFYVVLERQDSYLISTLLEWKAKKCNIPEVNKLEYEKWVSKTEVRLIGDSNGKGNSWGML